MVKTTPAAMDSPAEPTVCVMLFSRMVARPRARKIVIDRTAMGIEALTVRPIFSARYTLEAPKMIPSSAPRTSERTVSSAGASDAGTYGWKSAIVADNIGPLWHTAIEGGQIITIGAVW